MIGAPGSFFGWSRTDLVKSGWYLRDVFVLIFGKTTGLAGMILMSLARWGTDTFAGSTLAIGLLTSFLLMGLLATTGFLDTGLGAGFTAFLGAGAAFLTGFTAFLGAGLALATGFLAIGFLAAGFALATGFLAGAAFFTGLAAFLATGFPFFTGAFFFVAILFSFF